MPASRYRIGLNGRPIDETVKLSKQMAFILNIVACQHQSLDLRRPAEPFMNNLGGIESQGDGVTTHE